MGLTFYPLDTLPQQYDVVWCLYPQSGLAPGPIARPSLILDVRVNQKQEIGGVICTYGTRQFTPEQMKEDLVVLAPEYMALGLHKATRFALSLNSRMQLAWCTEYFVPPGYLKAENIKIGSLSDGQIQRLLGCLKHRGLEPYA